MDSYFQRTFRLPTDIVRLIFEFATLRQELITGRAQLKDNSDWVTVHPINYRFFRNWAYVLDRVDDDGNLMVYDGENRVRVVYITGF